MPGSVSSLRLSKALQDPKAQAAAIAEIARAFRKTRGNAVRAAKELGVSHSALMRWVRSFPELEQRVAEVRKMFGAPHEVGAPKRRKLPQ